MSVILSIVGENLKVTRTNTSEEWPLGHLTIHKDAAGIFRIRRVGDFDRENCITKGVLSDFLDERGDPFPSDQSLFNYLAATADGEAIIDASGRKRVSLLNTLLDLKQFNNNAPQFYDRENINGATQTWSKAVGGVTMSVTSNGDAAISQSFMYAPYFAGKSQLIELTANGCHNEAGVTKRVGYFSSNSVSPFDSNKDGIWFESDGTNYRYRIQKDGVDIFNEIDTSGIDFSKFNILVIQFLYLGGTAVKFGWIVSGGVQWKTSYTHAGLVANTFINSPNQPVRYEIRSTGGAGSLGQICAQVASEGSTGEIGTSRAVECDDLQANSVGVDYAAIGLRLKSDYKNIRIDKEAVELIAETNDDFKWRLCLNPTISGTFTYAGVDQSSFEAAIGDGTQVATDLGVVVDSGFGTGNSQISRDFKNQRRIGSKIDGTMETLVLVITPIATTNLDLWTNLIVSEMI